MSQKTMGDLRATNLAHLLGDLGAAYGVADRLCFCGDPIWFGADPVDCFTHPDQKNRGHIFAIDRCCLPRAVGRQRRDRDGPISWSRSCWWRCCSTGGHSRFERSRWRQLSFLLIQPEALVGPGFQMSFAATTALGPGVRRECGRFNTQRLAQMRCVAVLSVVLVLGGGGVGDGTLCRRAISINVRALRPRRQPVLSVPLMGLVRDAGRRSGGGALPLIGGWGAGLWIMEQGLRWILWRWPTGSRRYRRRAWAMSSRPTPQLWCRVLALGLLVAGALARAGPGSLGAVHRRCFAGADLDAKHAARSLGRRFKGGLIGVMRRQWPRACRGPRASGFAAGNLARE